MVKRSDSEKPEKHGSQLVPHWVLGPKISKFGPMGPIIFAQKFLYTKLVRYHEVILWGFEAKIVFGAKPGLEIRLFEKNSRRKKLKTQGKNSITQE